MQEIEIRSHIEDKDKNDIIKNLEKLGFKQAKKIVQHDIMFDKPDASLFKSGCKIRYRIEGDKKEITYKGSLLGSDKISKRTELNIALKDANLQDVNDFFTSLGYPMLFQVKKDRLVYNLDGVSISFDDWPIIGCLMEIEGDEEKIKTIAEKVAPKYEFKNLRLKEYFLDKMQKTGKTIDELIQEYEKTSGFILGNLALSLGL